MEPHLDGLPAEVQIAILRQLDSISSLTSLLKASPRILKVYHTNRDVIFPDIVYNQTTSLALRAWHLRHLDKASDMDTFTTTYDCTPDVSDLCISDWKELYRYHRVVDEMLKDSAKRALNALSPYSSPPLSAPISAALSVAEHRRLVRGYYNWELLTSISGRYYRMRISDMDNNTASPSSSTSRYLEYLCSFRDALAFHEVEEVLFVAHYLREKLYDYADQAEDYRFATWQKAGPYKYRYDFEDSDDWIWSNGWREAQDLWVMQTLYGGNLADVHQIVEVSEPAARTRCLQEFANSTHGYLTRDRLEVLQELTVMLKNQRDATKYTLPSYLPPGCSSGKIDWTQLTFADKIDSPNIGLLWGYKMSMEPVTEVLDQLGVGGIAIWDYARLQSMAILQKYPGAVLDFDELRLMGERERATRSVESRAFRVEHDWIKKGLMKPDWKPGWMSWGQSDDEDNSETLDVEQHEPEEVVLE